MKIVLDTTTKQAVCPPEFFENIRKINDAAELTESSKNLTSEDYLKKIIDECSKVIVNKNDVTKRRGSKKKAEMKNKLGTLVLEPIENN